MRSAGFPPFARNDACILILGSLPGAASLAAGQYYAQARNAFWPIMGALFSALPELPYEERIGRLLQHHIALWDVCATARRPGSLDSAITAEVPNDFAAFFTQHPHIGRICFNGAKAAAIYDRKVRPALSAALQTLPRFVLPSTSPAHAGMPLAEKCARWREALCA